jgi:hypothetical protein
MLAMNRRLRTAAVAEVSCVLLDKETRECTYSPTEER